MAISNIEEVINKLKDVIDWAYKENSRLGFFPAFYRRVTIKMLILISTLAFLLLRFRTKIK